MAEERKSFIYIKGRGSTPVTVLHHEGGMVRISDGYVSWRVSRGEPTVTKPWRLIETVSEGNPRAFLPEEGEDGDDEGD